MDQRGNRRLPRVIALAIVAVTVLLAAACGDGGTEPEPPQPNRAPVATGSIPAQTIAVGESATVSVASAFRDPDGDALTYAAASSAPGVAGVTVSGADLTLRGASVGTATVTVTASDPGGLSAQQAFEVTVPNRAPAPTDSIPDQTVQAGDSVSVNLAEHFRDPDGDTLSYAAESSAADVATVAVSGARVTITGVSGGTATVTVVASDPDGLSTRQAFEVTVPNRPPAPTDSIPDQTVQAGDSVSVNLAEHFTDPDGDALAFEAGSSAPEVVSVTVSGTSMTVTGVSGGTATITVAASDPGGLAAEQAFEVEVPNRPPVVTDSIPGQTVQAGDSVTLDLAEHFTDPDGDALAFEAESSAPEVASVAVSGTSMTVTGVSGGAAAMSVTASDPGGLSAGQAFEVTVPNRAPVVTDIIPAQMVQAGGSVTLDLTNHFSDPDADALTYAAISSAPGVAGVAVSGTNLTVSGVSAGTANVTVTASDPGGLSASLGVHVAVEPSPPARVCARTPQVRDEIVRVTGAVNCGAVTAADLAGIRVLNLSQGGGGAAQASVREDPPTGDRRQASLAEEARLAEQKDRAAAARNAGRARITALREGDFAGLSSLDTLDLSLNDLTKLPEKVFVGLSNLRDLALGANDLTTLPGGLFAGLSSLTRLELWINDLPSLPEGLFADLASLERLFLSSNDLAALPVGVFAGLSNLRMLWLDGNQLQTLPVGVFAGLSNLFSLELDPNPGAPFELALRLERTDGEAGAPPPASVRLALAEGAPFAITVPLSVRGGAASAASAVLPAGSTAGPVVTATQATAAQPVRITAASLPAIPALFSGVELASSAQLVLFIGADDLFIATDSLRAAHVSIPFSQGLVAIGGSGAGQVWRLADGSRVPDGLTLSSDGTISGTPVAAGVTEFGVRVVDSEENEATATVVARVCEGPTSLEEGDYRVYEMAGLHPCGFSIRATADGAYYRVVMVETDPDAQRLHDVELSVDGAPASRAAVVVASRGGTRRREAGIPGWQEVLREEDAYARAHARLRAGEAELVRRLLAEGPLPVLPDRSHETARDAAGTRSAPEELEFRIGRGGASCQLDTTVTARLIAENDHLAVYEHGTSVAAENVRRMLDYYADHGAEVIDRYFGGVSDVNGDGLVNVLIRPDLGDARAYVWSADMTIPQTRCAASNEMELIHFEAAMIDEVSDNAFYALGTIVHEMKHVSSLHKRYRGAALRGAGTANAVFHPIWIEEGRAEVAKEVASRTAWRRAGGPELTDRVSGDVLLPAIRSSADTRDEAFGVFSTMARVVWAFSPEPNAITHDLDGDVSVYGSGWHFHRFLLDWIVNDRASHTAAADLMRELNDSLTVPGVDGIVAVTARPVEELLAEHAIAMTLAGSEDIVGDDVPRFATYDFPTATEIFSTPDPPGFYPWPVTTAGEDTDAGFAPVAVPLATAGTRAFRGRLAASGLRFHDFRARGTDAAAFHFDIPASARVIVARIPDPDPPEP